jgi:parvulin-like peptidyl-prolyl isomerase
MRKTCGAPRRGLLVTTAVAGAVAAAVLQGCGQPSAQPLQPDAFLTRRQVDGTGRTQAVDQSGPLVVGTVNPTGPAKPPAGGNASTGDGIPRAVTDTVKPVTDPGFQSPEVPAANATGTNATPAVPTTVPGKADPALAQAGGYQLVGTVLADVNGSPIYADRVLAIIEKPLAAAAKQMDEQAFRAAAAQSINQQIAELINAELEYATAQRLLDNQAQAEARARTVQWRIEQVTAAGGSEEMARKKWANEGFDFEERAQEEYRTIMRRLYYTKKEHPKIQVRQTDIRNYYEANRAKEFTTLGGARFRVIKVDFKRTGGRDAALAKAQQIEKRARAGEDFGKLAATMNDEPLFAQPFAEPFAKGAFAVEEVDEAVWKVENGQITPLIETKDAFYLAQLEKKEAGRTIPFEEAQEAIVRKLRMQQFGTLRAGVQKRLREDAIIKLHPQMLQVAMDMVMQRYPTWRSAAASAQ